MSCEEIQESLSLYFDDSLTADARSTCDGHLDVCPVCRARLAELRSITRSLGMLATPIAPADLVSSINQALLSEATARQRRQQTTLGDVLLRWLQPRAAQYAVSSLASVLLFATVFLALRPHMIALHEAALAIDEAGEGRAAPDLQAISYDITQPISSASYAALRAPFSAESPSLNPSGALATLAWGSGGQNQGRGDADDMVVVADVFSNGVASLADVVQAPRDRRMLDELQKALRHDAAFVPASLDGRPGTMRVVFSVQRVDVRDRSF
jgi:anti-sigma factor RsiW